MDTLGNSLCVKFVSQVATVHPELQASAAFGNPSFMQGFGFTLLLPKKMLLNFEITFDPSCRYIRCIYLLHMMHCHKWMLKFRFKKLIYVNWRIITLQQCDGFFATHQYEPAVGTHVSPPSCTPLTSYPTPSLQVSTEPPLWVPWVIHQTCTVLSVVHMVMYMFQCCSLKSSHPLLSLMALYWQSDLDWSFYPRLDYLCQPVYVQQYKLIMKVSRPQST